MNKFRNFFYNDKKINSRRCSEKVIKNNGLWEDLFEETNFLDGRFTLMDRIYCASNGVSEPPKCQGCGNTHNKRNTDSKDGGYRKFCSKKCLKENLGNLISNGRKKTDECVADKKRRQTMLRKYGVEYNSHRKDISGDRLRGVRNQISDYTKKMLDDKQWLIEQYINKQRNLTGIAKEIGCHYTTLSGKLQEYGIEIRSGSSTSNYEYEISQFLENRGLYIQRNKKIIYPHELDIFVPNVNFAIEFNGIWAHTELQKDKKYHLLKTQKAASKGISLIHIFEDEWVDKEEICKSIILSKCGIFSNKYGARQTVLITDYNVKEVRKFLEENHLQGSPRSIKKSYSLFNENEIVMTMTFGIHPRDNSKIVLNRLCTAKNTLIVGGASKLFKMAKNDFNEIITWSDNRWSDGNIYKSLGFELDKEFGPDYSWVENEGRIPIRHSKQSRKKSSTGQPKEMTEKEYNESLGWVRIWDCGKKRWVWNKKGEPKLP